MAVYKRTYTTYSGPLTPPRTRFLVLPRYSYERLFQSRFLTGFLVACFFFPLANDIVYSLPSRRTQTWSFVESALTTETPTP